MNVHYTGRNLEVPLVVRKDVETRLKKLQKVVGPRPSMETRVIIAKERHLLMVEITVNLRDHAVVGVGSTRELRASVDEALDNLERQALKHKTRLRVKKRHVHPAASRSIRTLRTNPAVA
jgi:ribosomal subunit interface protein